MFSRMGSPAATHALLGSPGVIPLPIVGRGIQFFSRPIRHVAVHAARAFAGPQCAPAQ